MQERFESRVNKSGDCWIWTGAKTWTGYGVLGVKGRKAMVLAHRLSWMLHRGETIGRNYVLHRCDNPKCVNPDHLFLGTARDNRLDCLAKGRSRLGGCITPKLSAADVCRIKESPESSSALARYFGVNRETIRKVLRGDTWKYCQN